MAVQRRIPKVGDLTPLIRFRKPRLDRTQRRLDDALTIHDLRRIAKRRTPKAAFDYTDGAAEDEISLDRARQAFATSSFTPQSSATSPKSRPVGRCWAGRLRCRSGSRRQVLPG